MPSCAANSEAGSPTLETIEATGRFLAGRGIFGVVWLDAEMRPVMRFGDLVGDVALGRPITESLVAFIGLEAEMAALKTTPDRSVTLPSVRMQGPSGSGEHVNLAMYWMAGESCYVLLIARAVSRHDVAQRLAAETRKRLMAEEALAAKAQELARANAELAAANHDLAEFAYVISHDLRAPLRGLRYAATDAQAALVGGEAEAATEHLTRVIERARRMGAMLTGLLEYSRIGRKSDAAVVLDTRALAEEIAASSTEGSPHRITVEGTWPELETIAEPLDIVVRNLVDNAVKHHDGERGCIRVACEETADRLIITVADDGPGIEPEWHRAIFEPFKQIADADEAPPDGAGIGLALVKKTVERFGGSVSVESDPARARGTTFRVEWPKAHGP